MHPLLTFLPRAVSNVGRFFDMSEISRPDALVPSSRPTRSTPSSYIESANHLHRLVRTQTHPFKQILLRQLNQLAKGLKILYLFICNYTSILVLWSLLGLVCSDRLMHRSIDVPSSPPPIQSTSSDHASSLYTLSAAANMSKRFLMAMFWISHAALDTCIANQRLPSGIMEDRILKPYRPIVSGKITSEAALKLRFAVYLTGYIFSRCTGSRGAFIVSVIATYCYNDLGGAQGLWIIRDMLVTVGLGSWLFGCISVAGGKQGPYPTGDMFALCLFALAMASTAAIQDFRDLDGDRATGRRTMPMVLGDGVARFIMAISLLIWSFAVPVLLGKYGMMGVVLNVSGVCMAMRLIFMRNRAADKRSLEYWYGWIAVLCLVVI